MFFGWHVISRAPIILGGSGFYTKIRYAKPLPKGASYVLVANHTSYIDPFVMLRVSKNPFVFVGKKRAGQDSHLWIPL